MAKLIDGKQISADVREQVRLDVIKLRENKIVPCLAVVQVGDDAASSVYVRNKQKACEQAGIESRGYSLPADTTQAQLLQLVEELNADKSVNGILVQLPLPKQIHADAVIDAIAPEKDVDGFHARSVGALALGTPGFVSCTPAGIMELLRRSGVALEGAQCVVIGRSNIVGKPVSLLLLRENATVTICHSKTRGLSEVAKRADVLIVAMGKPRYVNADFVKPGATVIDVGIHRMDNGKLCGDVDFESVEPIAGAITPVPGGVGPMTIAMLLKNCVQAAQNQQISK